MKIQITLFILLCLNSCGGTQVGNALNVTLGATDDSVSQGALSFSDSLSTVTNAMISVRAVALRPGSDCSSTNPQTNTWVVKKGINKIFDYLSSSTAQISILKTTDKSLCQVRLIAGPALSGSHSGKSIYFTGTDSNGIAFTVQSTRFHPFALSLDPVSIENVAEVRSLISRTDALRDLDLSALGENPVTISPTEHAGAFGLFLRGLRRALIGHLLSSTSDSTPDPSSASALGDDEVTEVESIEEN